MPGFEGALRGDKARLDAIRMLVNLLSTQSVGIPARFVQAGENIRAERRLPKVCWIEMADFAQAFLPTIPSPPYTLALYSALEIALSLIFRKHQMKGPPRKADRKIFGRLMPRKDFESMIVSHGGAPPTMVAAAVDNLLSGATSAIHFLKNIPLGNHLMWSTYCEEIDDPDPFRPREPDHIKFVDSLGLFPPRYDFYIGLSYNSPAADTIRFPTIADAYGSIFFYGFRPGGRTRPVRYDDAAGRPEGVHPVLSGVSLSATLEAFGPL